MRQKMVGIRSTYGIASILVRVNIYTFTDIRLFQGEKSLRSDLKYQCHYLDYIFWHKISRVAEFFLQSWHISTSNLYRSQLRNFCRSKKKIGKKFSFTLKPAYVDYLIADSLLENYPIKPF